ncbi:MAG TPA: hypothetical protein DEP00_03985 [Lachnospiraceae bacterium]|nr:hypothetical protein [Lachnospiraceae bacterium]
MTLTATVTKWGNSLGVRLPSDIVHLNQIKEGEVVVLLSTASPILGLFSLT